MRNDEFQSPTKLAWRYAVDFYLRHYHHGLGYLTLACGIVFGIVDFFSLIYVLTFAREGWTPAPFPIVLMAGCFVLMLLSFITYRFLLLRARNFAFDCTLGGNETYADIRSFFYSYVNHD